MSLLFFYSSFNLASAASFFKLSIDLLSLRNSYIYSRPFLRISFLYWIRSGVSGGNGVSGVKISEGERSPIDYK
jgi:hypothetical protein